jgi:hypothetical protein
MPGVKSGAAAMPTMAATRSGCARASFIAIQPPMEEPTTICGPLVSSSSTAAASSAQRVMQAFAAKSPLLSPWPR